MKKLIILCCVIAFQAQAKLLVDIPSKEGPAILRFEKGVGVFYRGKKILEHDEELFRKLWDDGFVCGQDRVFRENVESMLNSRKEIKDTLKDWK